MIRVNAAFPISPYSELSIGSDPLRRFHAALCTQLSRYINCGARVRLNTISWRDAGLDLGAMINASAMLRGGIPKSESSQVISLRLGVQSVVGESLHLFADISPNPSNNSSASSWLASMFKNVQIGFGISDLNGGIANRRFPYGVDTFVKIEF